MFRRHLVRHACLAGLVATCFASGASAMPLRDVSGLDEQALVPARVDATAHEATIRGIGAALAERNLR
jgi:hypothetical protein